MHKPVVSIALLFVALVGFPSQSHSSDGKEYFPGLTKELASKYDLKRMLLHLCEFHKRLVFSPEEKAAHEAEQYRLLIGMFHSIQDLGVHVVDYVRTPENEALYRKLDKEFIVVDLPFPSSDQSEMSDYAWMRIRARKMAEQQRWCVDVHDQYHQIVNDYLSRLQPVN